MSPEARLLRLEDIEVTRGSELVEFKKEVREDLNEIREAQSAIQKLLISVLASIIVGVATAIIVAAAVASG